MNLAIDRDTPESFVNRVVLHEFGHAIGFVHEHSSPNGSIPWDVPKVIEYYERTQGWSAEKTKYNVLSKYAVAQVNASVYDPLSIMHYSIPNSLTVGNFEVPWNAVLSENDKSWARLIYPSNNSGPTIRMIKSNKNISLTIHATGGAKHGAQLKLHENCKDNNSDCMWFWKNGMIVSGADPSLAIHADHGAKHGAALKLHNNCHSGNPDCTWFWQKGMIVNGGNPSLAFHAYHGARHGAEIKLHNQCKPENQDCSWAFLR